MPFRLFAMWLLIFFVAFPVLAQRKRDTSKVSPKDTSPVWSSTPFDLSVEQLPERFNGHSVLSIWGEIAKRKKLLVKDEFESTIDYRNRIAILEKTPLFGSTTVRNLVAFSFATDPPQLDSKYDADLTMLNIILTWGRESVAREPVLEWSSKTENKGSGRVHVAVISKYFITADLRSLIPLIGAKYSLDGYGPPRFEAGVFAPPSKARPLKSTVRALVIGIIRNPSLFAWTDYRGESSISPYEANVFTFQYGLALSVKEVWFYDYATGEVLVRFHDHTQDPPEVAPTKP